VRVIGGGHSWTPMVNSSDHLLSLDEFDRIISIDKEKLQATFEAGIRIGSLARALEPHGLGIQNMGTTDKQSFVTYCLCFVSLASHP
jgi:L-gulono-1,4-lactone dehydrogenase